MINENKNKSMKSVELCYVKLDNGEFMVQIPDPDSKWGFYLITSDDGFDTSSFDGGFGCGSLSWVPVWFNEVPEEVKNRLQWIIDEC